MALIFLRCFSREATHTHARVHTHTHTHARAREMSTRRFVELRRRGPRIKRRHSGGSRIRQCTEHTRARVRSRSSNITQIGNDDAHPNRSRGASRSKDNAIYKANTWRLSSRTARFYTHSRSRRLRLITIDHSLQGILPES